MADIRPFRGVRYNRDLSSDMACLICPPYDVISPELEEELYALSEHNFVRLEQGRMLPQDTDTDNRYTRSRAILERWLAEGVLKVDDKPAIYIHDQLFQSQGKKFCRRGIVAAVKLEEWQSGVIRPHEGTLRKAGGDRLSLLWALSANTSPIMAMYEDKGDRVAGLLASEAEAEPLINVDCPWGQGHRLWAVEDPSVIEEIRALLELQSLYIADGHHRYESALTYRRERRECCGATSGEEAFDFVAITLISLTDPGLEVLSPHRLVRGISKTALADLPAEIESLFSVEEIALDAPDSWERVGKLLADKGAGGVGLGLIGLGEGQLLWLTVRDFARTDGLMPYFHSDIYKRLAVSLIDHVILEEMLGLNVGQHEDDIAYCYDMKQAAARVADGEYQMAFLLSPIGTDVIKVVADAGERLPRKSTYFYPKLPAGLLLRRLD